MASIRGEMRGSMTLRDEKGKVLARYSLVNNSTKVVNGKSLGRGNWLAQLLVEYVASLSCEKTAVAEVDSGNEPETLNKMAESDN